MASKDAQEDIVGAANAIQPGSFLYVTATAELPPDIESQRKMAARLAALKARFAPVGDQLQEPWMNKKDFHKASAFLAKAFLNQGFNGRADGKFFPLVHIAYKDSSWMTTIGGYFGDERTGQIITSKVVRDHPFLMGERDGSPFVLEQFNLTDAERAIFDRAVTSKPRHVACKNQLDRLGFRRSILAQYKDLMRFLPRYVESVL